MQALLRAWIERATASLAAARAGLNSENVYPVADGDTGTNVWATLEAGRNGLATSDYESDSALLSAFARGALLGARGNSGVIASQILTGFARGYSEGFVAAFKSAEVAAYQAVSEPRESTILSGIRSAALAAADLQADDPAASDNDIIRAAWSAARAEAIRTAANPPIPAAMGIIDAGAHALERMLAAMVETFDPQAGEISGIEFTPRANATRQSATDGEFEVMYLLQSDSETSVQRLKSELERIGSSVLVVGEAPTWNVHVHLDNAGAAIEAGLNAGRPYQIRISTLTDHTELDVGRKVITVANGTGFSELLHQSHVTVIEALDSRRVESQEWVDAAIGANEVLLLPHDNAGKRSAEGAVTAIRRSGARVAVLPSHSPVQTLAAIAIHDTNVKFDDVMVAMTEVIAHSQYATLAIARREIETPVGTCAVGDHLGLINGVIRVITPTIEAAISETLQRMLISGGELLTIVIGKDATEELAIFAEQQARNLNPRIDVSILNGGQAWYPLLFGLE